MTLKTRSWMGAVLALLIGALSPRTAAAQEYATPEADVKAFYPWYIQQVDQLKDPLLNDHIYAYVEKATVDGLRDAAKHNKLPGDADYFMKVQDVDPSDWNSHTVVRPAIMLDDPLMHDLIAVTIATFGVSGTKSNVVIFLRKHGSTWKIMKVENTHATF